MQHTPHIQNIWKPQKVYENTQLTVHKCQLFTNFCFFAIYFNGNFIFCVVQQVKQLQSLVQSAAVNREAITSPIPVPVPSTSLQFHQMSSFRMHRQYIRTLPFNSQIYGWVCCCCCFFFVPLPLSLLFSMTLIHYYKI